MDRFAGGVCSATGKDFDFAISKFDRGFDHREVFVGVEGGRFSGGADGNDPGDSGCDLAFDESLKCVTIEMSVAEGSDESREGACKHWGNSN